MEEQTNASGESMVDSVEPEVETKQQDTVAYDSYKKVLGDVKKWKSRFQETEDTQKKLQQQLQSYEEEKMQQSGKMDELVVSLREQKLQLERKLQEKDSLYGLVQTQYAIKEEAAKQGCTDTDVLMRLVDKGTLSGIELEEGYRPRTEQVRELVEEIKKKTDHLSLFKKEPIRVHDAPVRGIAAQESKSLKDMDMSQLEGMLKK